MVQLLIHQLMKVRGITAYALSRGTDLAYPTAYRLSRPGGAFGRLHAETLDRLCQFFRVQPGKLVRWVPSVGADQRPLPTAARDRDACAHGAQRVCESGNGSRADRRGRRVRRGP